VEPILKHSLPEQVSKIGQQHCHEGAAACTHAMNACLMLKV
jgi:hypothetical protein